MNGSMENNSGLGVLSAAPPNVKGWNGAALVTLSGINVLRTSAEKTLKILQVGKMILVAMVRLEPVDVRSIAS